jgi:DNA-binding LacI/PurR family transcriptional regulator
MGALAVRILIDKIKNGTPAGVNQIILEPELIIRNSCGYRLYGYQLEEPLKAGSLQES